ncbi:hypothetical protein IB267_31625 [Ensifer sp. ENS09]|uniref:hypothetical protein n=1 Tax=Ensifer sp. ENS09 TaxID=2769263 RepID=UPI00177C0BC0|nr:hypothetical protein [Ensifer sp. ENS09]MBD9652919.1 hypothetical protein [Ensifer sp. ENS09]
MARRRRRRRDGSPWAIVGIVGLLTLAAAAIGGFVILKSRTGKTPPLDADLCPATGAVSASAILLDLTDPISDITQVDLKRQFEATVSNIGIGGLIEVYAITNEEGKLKRTFRRCNPGTGAEADEWTQNRRKIQQRWEEAFSKPLKELSDSIGSDSESTTSPIMAGVQRIVIESFSDPKLNGGPKQLYVASDMLENTDAFSIYKSGADYEAFLKSPARDRFRTPLDGIDVKVWAFQRESTPGDRDLAEFWRQWVRANRGGFTGFERLTGIK